MTHKHTARPAQILRLMLLDLKGDGGNQPSRYYAQERRVRTAGPDGLPYERCSLDGKLL